MIRIVFKTTWLKRKHRKFCHWKEGKRKRHLRRI